MDHPEIGVWLKAGWRRRTFYRKGHFVFKYDDILSDGKVTKHISYANPVDMKLERMILQRDGWVKLG